MHRRLLLLRSPSLSLYYYYLLIQISYGTSKSTTTRMVTDLSLLFFEKKSSNLQNFIERWNGQLCWVDSEAISQGGRRLEEVGDESFCLIQLNVCLQECLLLNIRLHQISQDEHESWKKNLQEYHRLFFESSSVLVGREYLPTKTASVTRQ